MKMDNLNLEQITKRPAHLKKGYAKLYGAASYYQKDKTKNEGFRVKFDVIDADFKEALTERINVYIDQWNACDEAGQKETIKIYFEQLNNAKDLCTQSKGGAFTIFSITWFMEHIGAIPCDDYNGVVFGCEECKFIHMTLDQLMSGERIQL